MQIINKNPVWINNIELTYEVELMDNSKKTVFQAVEDMVTGVTIGTIQTSSGIYTPKVHCLFGPSPGAYQGEVLNIIQTGERSGKVTVAFSNEISQIQEVGFAGLFSVAAGDGLGTAYEMSFVRLIDMKLPYELIGCLPGPAFGSAGIRELLNISKNKRPLTALLLKPNTGQPSEHYASLAKEAALGGIDYIKEDELQFNHPQCTLADRVIQIVQKLSEAKQVTGNEVIYAPNVTSGSQSQIIDNAKKAVELGASAVMLNVMQVGLDSLKILREANIGVPIHIHRAGHDNYSRGSVGIDLNVLSLAFRLGGADLVHTGPVFGNLYDPNSIIANVKQIQSELSGVKDSVPILSRSAKNAVQDSIDYLSTDPEIKDPQNVMFLVDKDVYQDADISTGSITQATNEFVNIVKNVRVSLNTCKTDILKRQGYTVENQN